MNGIIKEFAKKIVGFIPTKAWISWRFKKRLGYNMDWKNPTTYNQKLQWLKLYNKKAVYTRMVDKFEAKDYVAKIIGEEYIIPTLAVWNDVDSIDFNVLPDQFVLKCTHDSGGLSIVENKENANQNEIKWKLKKALKKNPYTVDREWPYKNVRPRIIAEKYMKDSKTNELRDYKFFCFDGEVKALFVATDRNKQNTETKFDFFDADYKHLKIKNGHPNADILPAKPKNFDLMKELSEKLSKNIPHLRVDFYEVDDKVYFGELTFFHWSGMTAFEPLEWDEIFGDWITLPKR